MSRHSRVSVGLRRSLASVLAVLIAVTGLTLVTASSAQAAPPPGFQVTQVVGSGLNGPSGFEILPDGRILVLERAGLVKLVKNGQLQATPFANLPSTPSGDRGLIGVAADPNFANNQFVYFYYTGTDELNHLVRLSAATDVGADPFELYRTQSPSKELHVGGSIRFGPDGKLYFAVGDNGTSENGQNLANPHGKIIRINSDGSIPADNPFVGQAGKLPEIWAYGFRNPWRFQFDSATGQLYGGDVGDTTWEEVNHIVKGGNYGWPLMEGPVCRPADQTQCNGMIRPIYTWNHDTGNGPVSSAAVGGPVYRGSQFPPEYQGRYFFGDYGQGFIRSGLLDANGNMSDVKDFNAQAGSVVDMKVAPDGSLYYITYFPGRLYKVTYDLANHAPTANATADNLKGVQPVTVHFSSAGSSDPDNDPLTYLWDFGDGTTSTAANPVKTYANKGTYTVELTVSDGKTANQAVPLVVQVGIPPTLTIASPTDGSTYKAGDTIVSNAFASDGAGLDLSDANISTQVILHHCPSDCHVHPFLGPLAGRAHTFQLPDVGEASADTYFEVQVTATDANGLATTKSVTIRPVTSSFTVASNPPGLQQYLDGVPRTDHYAVRGVVNFKRELAAKPIQVGPDGTVYQFVSWSDGGAIRHVIATPAQATTYTANYAPAPGFVGQYWNNPDLQGAPALTRTDPAIDFQWPDSPGPGVQQDQFSVRWTKSQAFVAGRYKFTAAADEGFRLSVDGVLVSDHWAGVNESDSPVLDLAAGNHDLKFEYVDHGSGAFARLDWDTVSGGTTVTPPPAGPPPAGTGWHAKYWPTPGADGMKPPVPTTAPALERDEPADANGGFTHEWGPAAPGPGVPADDYVATFERTLAFDAATYNFTIASDDGARVIVDGATIYDKWIDQGATPVTVARAMTAGNHTVRVEYYEHAGDATVDLAIAKSTATPPPVNPPPDPNPPAGTGPATGWSGQYWNTPGADGQKPPIPTTAPVLTTTEPADAIDHVWGPAAPGAGVNADDYVARFLTTRTFAAGTYKWDVASDDGLRIFIDNVSVYDSWIDQGAPPKSFQVTLPAGTHTFRVEYYEHAGDATLKVKFALVGGTTPPPAAEPTNIWHAKYWNTPGADGNKPPIPTRVPDVARDETVPDNTGLDHLWGDLAPVAGITADDYVAQFFGTRTFAAGTYTFTVASDDGMRVYLDGATTPAYNQWIDQGAPVRTFTVDLTAGNHAIQVDYYAHAGGASLTLTWAQGGTPPVAQPPANPPPANPPPAATTLTASAFAAQYWTTPGAASPPVFPTGPPTLTRTDPAINFNWGFGAPGAGIDPDHFVAQWDGKITLRAAANVIFKVTSDDGIRVYLDGVAVPIIDDWSDRSPTTDQITKALTAGDHTLRVQYYEQGGTAVANFSAAIAA